MVNREERQRLLQVHAAEQVSVKRVIAICSAWLVLLAGIAAMGSFSSVDAGGARVVQVQR